jgi:hypothetical protein
LRAANLWQFINDTPYNPIAEWHKSLAQEISPEFTIRLWKIQGGGPKEPHGHFFQRRGLRWMKRDSGNRMPKKVRFKKKGDKTGGEQNQAINRRLREAEFLGL